MLITLEATPPEGTPYSAPFDAPYEATIRAARDEVDLATYQPGDEVALLMHRDDPTKFILATRAEARSSSASERG